MIYPDQVSAQKVCAALEQPLPKPIIYTVHRLDVFMNTFYQQAFKAGDRAGYVRCDNEKFQEKQKLEVKKVCDWCSDRGPTTAPLRDGWCWHLDPKSMTARYLYAVDHEV